MSWQLVARKDFEDVVRSRMFWAVIGVPMLLLVIAAFGVATENLDEIGQELVYDMFNNLGSQLLVPIMALMFGYLAIAAERQSGSLRILFGLTHNRRDVLIGKLASRSAAMVTAMLVASAVIVGLIMYLFGSLDVELFLKFLGLTVLLALSFTGIAVGISSMTGSRSRAMGGAAGIYVVFMILWYPAVAILHYALEGELAGVEAPNWYLGLLMLNPLNAYSEALGQAAGEYFGSFISWPTIVEDIPQELLTEQTTLLLSNRAAEAPFYLDGWFAGFVMLVWFVVPVAVGHYKFERADLN